MKMIELQVEILKYNKTTVLRYEWFGLKNQAKRVRVWVELDEETIQE